MRVFKKGYKAISTHPKTRTWAYLETLLEMRPSPRPSDGALPTKAHGARSLRSHVATIPCSVGGGVAPATLRLPWRLRFCTNSNGFLPTRTFDLHVLPAHVPPPILPKSQYQPQISLLEGNVAPKLAYLKAKLPLTLILTLILCFGFSIYGRFWPSRVSSAGRECVT